MSAARVLRVRCAYCSTGEVSVHLVGAMLRRSAIVDRCQCPDCDSIFTIEVSTKRVSKGKRLKASEAQQAAELARQVAAAVEENNRIAAHLLATPGCTCAANAPNAETAAHYGKRRDGLELGGELRGIPLPPKHRYACPCSSDARLARAQPRSA